MSDPSSAVLLAAVGALHGNATPAAVLTAAQRQVLKMALELPGAAIAVTASGEYLGIYNSTAVALEAAIAFQAAVGRLAPQAPPAFGGRVVLELWPADSAHMPVEHAREVMHHAREHSILVTPGFAEEMAPNQRLHLVSYGRVDSPEALQGVVELIWRDRASTFRESTQQASLSKKGQLYAAIMLTRRGRHVIVRPDDCPFSMGRDTACALNIGGPSVSRLHGAILYEGSKFYLRDDSRNGTYLTTGGEEILLRGERFPLVSKGIISPGMELMLQTGDVIRYQCLVNNPEDS